MKGLYNKYVITKFNGGAIDPEARYFVLRYDKKDRLGIHYRSALRKLAHDIRDINPDLSEDLFCALGEDEQQ